MVDPGFVKLLRLRTVGRVRFFSFWEVKSETFSEGFSVWLLNC